MNAPDLLTLLMLLPLAGAAGCALLPRTATRACAVGTAAAVLGIAVLTVIGYDPRLGELQAVVRHTWIPALGVDYHVGIDGISVGFVVATALLVLLTLCASPRTLSGDRGFAGLVLVMESMLLTAFSAQNFFLWFLGYELSLIPAYLLIRLWGGPRRDGASLQFLLTTQAGSVALLVGFLALQRATGTFDLPTLATLGARGELAPALAATFGSASAAMLVCALVVAALAVKIPLVPVHTWLPAAYAEAPTPVTMLLTGALSKLGLYGLFRLALPLFPAELAQMRPVLLVVAAVTVVGSAFAALAQRDLKRILAYASVNHLGLCTLAVFAALGSAAGPDRDAALLGALLLGLNHAVTAPALFWFAGLLSDRAGGRRGLGDFGGIRAAAPVLAGAMGVAVFASLGLPGLNGFPGELLILRGVLPLAPWAGAAALVGLLITAAFLLRLIHRVFHGPAGPASGSVTDLGIGERWIAAAFVGIIVVLGVWPRWVTDIVEVSLRRISL
jgi:NADH-quinone oxidoreductase subunit M